MQFRDFGKQMLLCGLAMIGLGILLSSSTEFGFGTVFGPLALLAGLFTSLAGCVAFSQQLDEARCGQIGLSAFAVFVLSCSLFMSGLLPIHGGQGL